MIFYSFENPAMSTVEEKLEMVLNSLQFPTVLINLTIQFVYYDIIVDGVPRYQCNTSIEVLALAERIHFNPTFNITNDMYFQYITKMTGIPTVLATDMSRMFKYADNFNPNDIKEWDTSKVKRKFIKM